MRVLLLGILLILPAFSQPKVKQPCRDGVTTNCTPQAGADGSVPMASTVLGPYTLAQLNALTPPVTAIAVVTDSANCTSQTIGQVQLCRYVSAGTWASIGGGGGGGTVTATFLLCAGPCTANETSNWRWTAPAAVAVAGCIVDAMIYPTGAAITVDVLKGGTTTIFTSTVPTLAAGSSAYNEQTGMAAAATLAKGDYLIAKVLTAGSTIAGQNINLTCKLTY